MRIDDCHLDELHQHPARDIAELRGVADRSGLPHAEQFLRIHCNPDVRRRFTRAWGTSPADTFAAFATQLDDLAHQRQQEEDAAWEENAAAWLEDALTKDELLAAHRGGLTLAEVRRQRWANGRARRDAITVLASVNLAGRIGPNVQRLLREVGGDQSDHLD